MLLKRIKFHIFFTSLAMTTCSLLSGKWHPLAVCWKADSFALVWMHRCATLCLGWFTSLQDNNNNPLVISVEIVSLQSVWPHHYPRLHSTATWLTGEVAMLRDQMKQGWVFCLFVYFSRLHFTHEKIKTEKGDGTIYHFSVPKIDLLWNSAASTTSVKTGVLCYN